MKKTLLIISREYLSRVRKKSFIILTILIPLLMVGIFGAITWITLQRGEPYTVTVIDRSGIFEEKLKNTADITFQYVHEDVDKQKEQLKGNKNDCLLFIPEFDEQDSVLPEAQLIAGKQPGMELTETVNQQLRDVLRNKRLVDAGIDTAFLNKSQNYLKISTKRVTDKGEEQSSTGAAMGISIAFTILIYMFVMVYASMVMRGVIEEKTSRIVEVLISSVKPFQLMMGKIVGIALVGLTQFLLWIVLGIVTASLAGAIFIKDPETIEQLQTAQAGGGVAQPAGNDHFAVNIMQALDTVNYPFLLACFLFYFLGGYLLYSALFAAIGSAVDSETETQQFMFPVTLPLFFAYILSFTLITKPDSPVLFWLSMIPLTSPVSMLVRIPFGVPGWQLALSMTLLVATFVFTVWMAARIYRTGILMYGKKVSFKELGKWLFYKG